MDVSHLRVKVSSDGITATGTKLDKLGKQAAVSDVKVNKLTDSIKKLIGAGTQLQQSQSRASASADAQAAAFTNLNTIVGQMARMMQQLIAANAQYTSGVSGMAAGANAAGNSFRYKGHWGGVVVSTLKAMTTATLVYLGLNLGKNIVQAADKWQNMHAKLTVVTKSQQNATRAMEDVFGVAQDLRTPLEGVTQLWTRLSPAMQRMGRSGDDTTRVVKSVATALQLSGATAAESSSAMLQLSQSFNAGRLNGAEFNSIAEAAPLILEAIALKTGKAREELKKMGSDGKITGQMMADALIDIGPKWDEMFYKLPITVGGALTLLKNRWAKEIGEMGRDTQFNQEIVKALKTLESLIPVIVQGLGAAFVGLMGWIEKNRTLLGEIWDQVTGLISDVWNLGKSTMAWAGEIAGAGGAFNPIGEAIFFVRLGIAGLIDGTKILAAAFAYIGGVVITAVMSPLASVGKLVKLIADSLVDLAKLSGKVAGVLGNEQAAKGANAQAEAFAAFGKNVEAYFTKATSLGAVAQQNAADWTKDIRDGNGEVQKLLKSREKLADFDSTEMARLKMKGNKTPWDESAWGPKSNYKPSDDKADKAKLKATKEWENTVNGLNQKLAEQVELQRRISAFGLDYDKISAGTKARIELERELSRATSEKTKGQLQFALGIALELESRERLIEQTLEQMRAEKGLLDAQTTKAKSLEEEAVAMERKVATYGMAKGAVEALEQAETQRQVTFLLNERELSEYGEKLLVQLQAQLEARRRLTDASQALGSLEAFDALDKALDPKKAENWGNRMKDAFGKVGGAVGKVVDVFAKYEKRQSQVAKNQKELAAMSKSDVRYAIMASEVKQKTAQASIDSYGDMAQAAKGFFEEGSRGYKSMEAAERVFRMASMAMELQAFMQKSGMWAALTSLFVTGETAKATAATSSAGVIVGANMAVGASAATAGVATQALGDPYTAFARIAAMAAIMAALGFAVGGSSKSGNVSAQRQAQQGTGTVFGDDNKKSESIVRGIEILADNSDIALEYSSGMLASLKNIEAALGGATNAIIRNRGELTGSGVTGSKSGPSMLQSAIFGGVVGILDNLLLGGTIGKLLGFGKSQTLKDSGISSGNQSIGDILTGGFQGRSYQDIETKKKAFGITYSDKTSRNFSDLDASVEQEFTRVIASMVDGVSSAADALGMDGQRVKEALKSVSISLGDISLKGMSGEEIEKTLSAVFSGFGDKLVSAGFGQALAAYQQAGEGLLETAIRVASGSETATYALEKLGLTAVSWQSLTNKQGDVGAEIVRQTVLMTEAGTGVGKIISELQGSATELASTYKQLLDIRQAMKAVSFNANLDRDLLRAAGGLEAMQDALVAYSEGFFTDAERNAAEATRLRGEFAKLGQVMPTTKAGFRSLIESLDANGSDSLAMKVMLLAGSFGALMDNMEGGAVEAARDALSEAYEREADALRNTKEKFEDFAKSLKEFRLDLVTGDLSPLSNTEKYVTLKAQYESTSSAAKRGDESAIAKFESIASEFLQFSREYNASGAGYNADFQRVMQETAALEELVGDRATEAEQQLAALNKQVEGLLQIDNSVKTVAQAIADLHAAIAAAALPSLPVAAPAAVSADKVRLQPVDRATAMSAPAATSASSNSANLALVAELKALRAEVTQLRTEQQQQTAALIGSNYFASEQNAQTIAEAAIESGNVNAWRNRMTTSEVLN